MLDKLGRSIEKEMPSVIVIPKLNPVLQKHPLLDLICDIRLI